MRDIVSLGPHLTQWLDWLPLPAFVRCRQGRLRYVNPALKAVATVSLELEPADPALADEDRRVFEGETIESVARFRNGVTNLDIILPVIKSAAWHPEWGEVVVAIGSHVERRSAREITTLAILKHELQTPLSAIAGLAELLLESTWRTDQRDSLRLIRSSAEDCRGLLTDILENSTPWRGEWSLRPAEISLREFLDAVLKPFTLRARARGLAFSHSVADPVPNRLYSDPLRLRQILQNLASNAVKFTERGSVEVLVSTVPGFRGGLGIQFNVRDTGIGIHPAKLEVIFEPFVQIHESTAQRYRGTGLGLSISARIAELLEGEIRVESKPGEGSTFTFVLPYRTAPKAPAVSSFDRRSALETAGGDTDLLRELAELFLEEYPKLIADLRTAVREKDAKQLDASAHALRGAVANFGAQAAVEAANWLEAKGRAGEIEGLQENLDALEKTLQPLLEELKRL